MIVILQKSKNIKQGNQGDMSYRTEKKISEEKITLCISGRNVAVEGAREIQGEVGLV